MLSRNTQGYEITYFIENILRQYLIRVMSHFKETTPLELIFGRIVTGKVIDDIKRIISENINVDDENIFLLNSLYKEFLKNKNEGKKLYNPVYYLTISDLLSILRRNKVKDYFITEFTEEDVTILFKYLDKMIPIRNSIAHNRNITDENITLLKMIKECLINQFNFDISNVEEVDTENIRYYLDQNIYYFKYLENKSISEVENLEGLKSNLLFLQNSYWNKLFYPESNNLIDNVLFDISSYLKVLSSPGGILEVSLKHKKLLSQLNQIILSYE